MQRGEHGITFVGQNRQMAYSLVWKLATSTQLDLIREVKTARAHLLRLNRKRKQQLREITTFRKLDQGNH